MSRGDVVLTFEVAPEDAERAQAALLESRFSIESVQEGTISIIRGTESANPDAETQEAVRLTAVEALDQYGIDHRLVSSGIVTAGGTPEHQWIAVTVDGRPTDLKILAANDAEADEQLDELAGELNVSRERLNIEPPPGWAGYGLPDVT